MQEQENHIIGLIYDAAMDSNLWPMAMQAIVEYTHSKSAIFIAFDQLNPQYNFTYSFNIAEAGLRAYQDEHVRLIDMRLHTPLFLQAGVGSVVAKDLKDYAFMSGTDQYIFYEKCMQPAGIAQFAGVLLDQGTYRWAVLGIHRAMQAENYTQTELEVLKRLGLHLRRALQIHRQLSSTAQLNRDLYQILDCLKVGVLLLDYQGRVTMSNQKAQHLMEHCQCISIDAQNRLKISRLDQAQLDALIYSAMLTQPNPEVGGVMTLQGSTRLRLTVVPLSKVYPYQMADIKPKVAIFMNNLDESFQLSHELLKTGYALSKREISICEAFLNGYNLQEIALAQGITLSSVRTYLKHIYTKMQCSSQVELMRMLQALVIDFEHVMPS